MEVVYLKMLYLIAEYMVFFFPKEIEDGTAFDKVAS